MSPLLGEPLPFLGREIGGPNFHALMAPTLRSSRPSVPFLPVGTIAPGCESR